MQLAPAPLVQLPTGVPGLDEVLGGGIPEYSCSLIAGGPGTGKTTLAQQILFANASTARPGLYFTGAGQSARKVLSYQQQFSFFDEHRVDRSVHIFNLTQRQGDGDVDRIIEAIAREVEDRRPGIVVVDLVTALMPLPAWNQLALYLAKCEATALLICDSDLLDSGMDVAPSTFDTILRLTHRLEGETMVRTIQVDKVRGQEPLAGAQHMRMTNDGMRVFPRWPTPKMRSLRSTPPARLTLGLDEVDQLLGGGVPAGDTLLVEGPTGTGKSVLATHFVVEGAHQGEPGLVVLFEERPDRFIQRAESFELCLSNLVEAGMVDVLSFRGRDMPADEVIDELQCAVTRIGARRVVIDSAESLDLTLTGRRGLHDCLWRLLDSLTGAGLTIWLNSTPEPGRQSLAALADDVMLLRRVEHETWNEYQMSIAKMRWSGHSNKVLSYEIDADGVHVWEPKVKPVQASGCLFDVPIIGASAPREVALAAAS